MDKKVLYIMCGPAGSGKTTWVRENVAPGVSAHISRDRIRFDILRPNESYFAREDDVYHEFCGEIHDALHCPWIKEVYADATHLTTKSRRQLLKNIMVDLNFIDVIPVVVKPSLDKCLMQNSQRTGRECVPETVIKNMYNSFVDPKCDGVDYADIIYVGKEDAYGG